MILRSAPASPFGRKVKIAAALLELGATLRSVDADTTDAADSLRRENPLGKIPTLVLDDGTTLYDSRVIVEYLDHLAGGHRLLPAEPAHRFRTLTLQALADGFTDAALLMVYEQRWRAEANRDARWTAHQGDKIERALGALEAAPPNGDIDIGHVALACGLGYLDLRFDGTWRATHPRLVTWLEAFAAAVPAFAATAFKPS
ncbi:glutathione S-transferase N-terminal domain-containing protein [Lichenihabitans sp. Uapishka_5]|uniref:glutathione S-transferase N-terminal domain-containing protein n=1 Tax=Lichenihabitans sp. Uapishka_5 TaxID=3037302 RepID=UPI0029E8186F|nr:glutathione S-transferase N-terminal domain-containing protein [Lichenihabitans sp. Uapishka_5]MDX7952458.1 glutathione S-transferase N-terminal domain-containing protein [Lichenihabitans sp. Uapishka_5]